MKKLNISVAAEPVFHIGEFPVTNSLLTSVVVMVVFLIIAVKAYFGSGKGRKKLPLWIRVVTEGVYNFLIWEYHHGEKVLVPFLRSPNASLSITIALALISVVTVQILSIKALGGKKYLGKFFNFKNPINGFVGILELISEFSKILSFSFRLFGNVFAGEVLLMVMMFLIPLIIPVPFLILEIFVGLIQALVFTMLTTIFIVVATEEHH
ncbi:MAG: ATP synthase subunit a [Candidatus Woesebacteria bacterium GW2011_GWA1_38_8]|uniref:ATP synthase subunit a n=2 Tax=Candidatus Woeseibacteriota TaxID=1752722 RepID=A0A0G0NA62_9BACT|nr:MAG: ATP synthase subunit a [Candidatus Woesebacteria bacterium GW2011_GWA1_38_8]